MQSTSTLEREKVVWNDERDLALIEALIIMRDQRTPEERNGFIKRSDWEEISLVLKSKFGGEYPHSSIRSRYNNLRNNWKSICRLRQLPGFEWNENRKMLLAPPEVWEVIGKENPEVKKWKKLAFPHFDRCTELWSDWNSKPMSHSSLHAADQNANQYSAYSLLSHPTSTLSSLTRTASPGNQPGNHMLLAPPSLMLPQEISSFTSGLTPDANTLAVHAGKRGLEVAHNDPMMAAKKVHLNEDTLDHISLILQILESRLHASRDGATNPPLNPTMMVKETEMKRAMDWLELRRLNYGDVDTGILVDAAMLFEDPNRAMLFMDLPEGVRLPWLLKYLTQGNPYLKH